MLRLQIEIISLNGSPQDSRWNLLIACFYPNGNVYEVIIFIIVVKKTLTHLHAINIYSKKRQKIVGDNRTL